MTSSLQEAPLAGAKPNEALGVPIVLFTNAWAMGGMERHLLDLACSLRSRGHQVAVVCFATPAIAPLREGLRARGIEVQELEGDGSPAGRARRFRQLLRIFRRFRGCLVHMVEGWPPSDGLVILAARLGGAKAAVRAEHQGPPAHVSPGQRLLMRVKDRFLDRVVCVSEGNRAAYIGALARRPDRLDVVPNGIDIKPFSAHEDAGLRAGLGLAAGAPLVGLVARLSEERKGADYFIEMAALVARDAPGARFIVVGDGALRPQLAAQAQRLGVGDLVFFLGERDDVPALLGALTVFVQPSLAEGASYVLLEAMAAGLPIVATPVGSAPQIIRDGENGLIVPLRDSDALAKAVLRLLDDRSFRERLARDGQMLVRERYSVEAMVDRYEALYRDVLKG